MKKTWIVAVLALILVLISGTASALPPSFSTTFDGYSATGHSYIYGGDGHGSGSTYYGCSGYERSVSVDYEYQNSLVDYVHVYASDYSTSGTAYASTAPGWGNYGPFRTTSDHFIQHNLNGYSTQTRVYY